jgi:integrase/recombinase XerC
MQAQAGQQLLDFLQQLKVERRVSEHTVKSYQSDLKHLRLFCEHHQLASWGELSSADPIMRIYICQIQRA